MFFRKYATTIALACGFISLQTAIASAQGTICLGSPISASVNVLTPQDNGSGYKFQNPGQTKVLDVRVTISGRYD